MVKLIKAHKFRGELIIKTGLHIGGNKDTLNIGGVDAPVIKVTENGRDYPYIPGSSIKGKLRSLLELSKGMKEVCKDPKDEVSLIFGCGDSQKIEYPGALIIRDAMLCQADKEKPHNELFQTKAENMIERKSGTAKSPRFIERVNPDLTFEIEFIIKEFEDVDYIKIKEAIIKTLKMLENDYLGGSGTRGYGKVDLTDLISKIEQDKEI